MKHSNIFFVCLLSILAFFHKFFSGRAKSIVMLMSVVMIIFFIIFGQILFGGRELLQGSALLWKKARIKLAQLISKNNSFIFRGKTNTDFPPFVFHLC